MNKKQEYKWIKESRSIFDWAIVTRDGSVNEVGSTSYLHEKVIFDICHYAKKYLIRPWNKIDFCKGEDPDVLHSIFLMADGKFIKSKALVFTEVRSICRKRRADILLIYPKEMRRIIIEVAANEKQSTMDNKKKFWEGKGFEFIEVKL